jgi:3-hydroxyacyl-[acyl-carrier-protein] dehydratase
MHFALIDTVLEQSETRVLAVKQVTLAEEYLQDHFPTFHVLPGVFMLEALVQAARHLLGAQDADASRWVLGGVRALRYGRFVRPGEALMVEVALEKRQPDGTVVFKGTGTVRRQGMASGASGAAPDDAETAVSGRFTMRPLRLAPQTPAGA